MATKIERLRRTSVRSRPPRAQRPLRPGFRAWVEGMSFGPTPRSAGRVTGARV